MANAVELAAKIAAIQEAVNELAGKFASSKGQVEQMVAQLNAVGVEGETRKFQAIVGICEESESGRATLEGGLTKAHWQVMSAVHGTMGPGAQGSGPGGKIMPQGQVVGVDGGPPPGGLDAIPPHLRQDPTPTGEELSGVDPSIGPFQKEHENAGADSRMNRLARAARIGVRNIEDLKAGGQQLVSGANADIDNFDAPPAGGYNTTTQVPDHIPQIHSVQAPQPSTTDIVGSAIVMAVVIAESAGRLIERRKRRHDGG